MAGGTLKRSDFFTDDVIGGYKDLVDAIEKAAKAQADLVKNMASNKASFDNDVKTKNDVKKAVQDLDKAEREAAKYRENIAKSIKTISEEEKKLLIQKEQSRRATAELNKEIKKQVDVLEGGKKSTNTWGNALTSFQAKWNAAGAAMATFAVTGVMAVVAAFKEAAKSVIEFGSKARELQTITGAGVIGMIQMQAAAIKMSIGMGQSGIKINESASSILEAFKLVASAKPELLGNAKALETVTEQALILAKASGTDVPTAVTSLTKIMNQFNAPAEQAGRYINVLAAGAKYGAGEIPYLADAVGRVGVVSKTANQPIEELSAVMELFAEKGLESEKAGTAYRNVLIKSMNDQKNYKDGVFSTQLMMQNLGKVQNDTTLLTKKFGVENVVVAQTLAQGADRIKELQKQMTGTNTAYEQAENNTRTLAESLKFLKTGLSALMAQTLNSNGAFKDLVDGVGAVVKAFIKWTSIPVSKQLVEEQGNMNALAGAAMQAANSTKLRTSYIEELQQKYPEYFGNLDKEKAKTEDIKKALDEANKAYVKKIQIAVVGEDLTKAQERYSKAFKEERDIQTQIADLYYKRFGSAGAELTVWQKIDKLKTTIYKNARKEEESTFLIQTAGERIASARIEQNSAQKDINKLLEEQAKIEDKLAAKTDIKKEEDKKNATKDNLQAQLDAIKRAKDNELNALQAIVIKSEEGSHAKLVAEIKYREALREWDLKPEARIESNPDDPTQRRIVYEKKTAGELAKINAQTDKEITDLRQSYNEKQLSQRINTLNWEKDALKRASDEESDIISGRLKIELESYATDIEKANISKDQKEKLLAELDQYEQAIIEDRDKRAERSANRQIAVAEDEAKRKLKLAQTGTSEGGREITPAEEYEMKHFLANERLKLMTANITAEKRKELMEKLSDAEKAMDDAVAANREKNEEKRKNAVERVESASQDFINTTFEFVKQGYQNQIDKYELDKEKELTILERQRAKGLITEAQYNNKKSKIEQDAAIKEAKTKRKMAEMDKVISLSQIVTQTAIAVMSAQKLLPPFSLIVSGIILATAALQTAMVVSQPLPEIPKFKHGTKSAPGGLSIVGDGGERELIKLPSGQMLWSASTPQLIDLPKYSQVIPGHEISKELVNRQNISYVQSRSDIDYGKLGKTIASNMPEQRPVYINVSGENLWVSNRYRR